MAVISHAYNMHTAGAHESEKNILGEGFRI